jgi:dihydrofolate reductase
VGAWPRNKGLELTRSAHQRPAAALAAQSRVRRPEEETLRRLIAFEFKSVDGYMAGPPGHEMDWVVDRFTAEMTSDIAAQYDDLSAFVMGRTTFESLAAYWPAGVSEKEPLRDRMNSMEKLVCTTRTTIPAWSNSRPLLGDAFQELSRIKQTADNDLMVIGSGSVVRALAARRLIDEFRFFVFPVALGAGMPLFAEPTTAMRLRTTRVRQFDGGVIRIDYAVEP